MSFWAATVITNLFSAVPWVGDAIVTWLWGGYSVDNPTLARFYAFHYLIPFLIVGVVWVHLWSLHKVKSGNPLGIDIKGPQDTIPFHPYYTVKDYFGFGMFFILYAAFVFFAPNLLGEPDNYIPANPLVTPPHIVPEWYFLPYYAILRAVPDIGAFGFVLVSAKLAGVIAMFASILVLFALPWLDRSPVRSGRFRPIFKQLFWLLVADCIVLGWVGANPPAGLFLTIGRIATAYYFLHFLVLLPLVSWLEKPKPLPESIAAAVTEGGGAAG
jgi:ubiquinol-cytochrome c reductase cytochrome b subunit